jgi:transposase
LAHPEKKACREGRLILFLDESAFYLLPMAVRTYAPKGQTPILRVPLSHDHLSAISAISPAGQLFLHVQDRAYDSVDVVKFLESILAVIKGKVLIIWDGGPIHKGDVIKEWLADGAAKRVQLERLPAYAPELNPDEGIWAYLKGVELKNVCCQNLQHLRRELAAAVFRLRRKRHIIQACFAEAGCSL